MMLSFKQFITEMASPGEHHKSMTFYHGTNEESAKKIIESGHIKGRDTQGKGQLDPVKGKAYMTKDIGYAQIYAIGGDMAGSNWWSSHAKGDHGYVFEVKGHHLKDIQPDEDQVGEMTVRPSWGDRTEHDNNGVHPHLKDMAKRVATSTQYRKAADGEMAPQAAIGKKMLKHMSDSDKLHMIDKGCHVAADGPVSVSRAWRIHKSKVQHLKSDGSNFFDHAEEVPLKHSVQEGKLARSIAIAGAVGLSVGATGGAKVGDHHNRVKHIEKVTKAAIENPFYDRHSSELSPYAMGDFAKSTDIPKEASAAKMKSDRQADSKSRMKVIHPNAVMTKDSGFRSYKGGKFSINSGSPEWMRNNPWHDNTKVKK